MSSVADVPTLPLPLPPSRALKGKFVYLFTAQVLMLVLSPFLDRPGWPMLSFRVIGLGVLLSALYAVSTSKLTWMLALALAVPTLILNSFFAFHSGPTLLVPTLLFTIAFLAFTLVLLLRRVMTVNRVTSDTIFGAISVYLLVALTFGVGYLLMVTLQPGALQPIPGRYPNHSLGWDDCLFYSYTTLTSVGYGDIVPVTPHARSFSVLEAMTGIMYIAVLIARLVGLYSAERSGRA